MPGSPNKPDSSAPAQFDPDNQSDEGRPSPGKDQDPNKAGEGQVAGQPAPGQSDVEKNK